MARERTGKRFPPWLRQRIPTGREAAKVRELLKGLRLRTVCQSALCPNIADCFHRGTATFLIMGGACTRNCRFCAVEKGGPAPLEPDEPARVAEAAASMRLSHVVITSVTRDDLADGGAAHFAETVRAVREATAATVEVLTSDFAGSRESVETMVRSRPDVFNHNVETVPRLYGAVRPMADYRRSLDVLRIAGEIGKALAHIEHEARRDKPRVSDDSRRDSRRAPHVPLAARPPVPHIAPPTALAGKPPVAHAPAAHAPVALGRMAIKSGVMVGLGETIPEVEEVLVDLREAGCTIVTVGQYLAPSKEHLAVERFVTPEEFAALEATALAMGFDAAPCAPLVRSSYHAGDVYAGRRRHEG